MLSSKYLRNVKNKWLYQYMERPQTRKYCYGIALMAPFPDTIQLVEEKIIDDKLEEANKNALLSD